MLHKRDCRNEDHDGDEEAHGRVSVEPLLAFCFPDGDGGDHDADIVHGVADDVEDDAYHVEVVSWGLQGEMCVAVFVMARSRLVRGSTRAGIGHRFDWDYRVA